MKNKTIKIILSFCLIFTCLTTGVIRDNITVHAATTIQSGITVLDYKGPDQSYSWHGFSNMHDYRCHNLLEIDGVAACEYWNSGDPRYDTYFPFHQWGTDAGKTAPTWPITTHGHTAATAKYEPCTIVTETIPATCTSAGYTREYCSKCHYEYSRTTIPAKGHDFDEGTITKSPTVYRTGIRHATCKNCSAVSDIEEPKYQFNIFIGTTRVAKLAKGSTLLYENTTGTYDKLPFVTK